MTQTETNTTRGFTSPLDLLVKSTPIPRLFLIGRVITHHFLEPARKPPKIVGNIDLSFPRTEKDRTYKAFAFSHTRLMYNDGTTLQDGTHELYVYKVSQFTFGLFFSSKYSGRRSFEHLRRFTASHSVIVAKYSGRRSVEHLRRFSVSHSVIALEQYLSKRRCLGKFDDGDNLFSALIDDQHLI